MAHREWQLLSDIKSGVMIVEVDAGGRVVTYAEVMGVAAASLGLSGACRVAVGDVDGDAVADVVVGDYHGTTATMGRVVVVIR